jgi:hypothetical protein
MFDAIRQNVLDVNELESMCFVKAAKKHEKLLSNHYQSNAFFCFFSLSIPLPLFFSRFSHIPFQINDVRYKNQTQG